MGCLTTKKRGLLPPDHRSREVREYLEKQGTKKKSSKKVPFASDPYMQELYLIVSGSPDDVSEDTYQAYLLNCIPYARAIMRAFLFCKAPLDAFVVATEVNENVIDAYRCLFFDPGVFPNKLIKVAYVRQLSIDTPEQKFERDMMMWGLQLGWEYLVWKVTGGRIKMSVPEALQHILTDSLWRSREHIFNSIMDQRSKESRAWIPQMIKVAEMVEKYNPDRINSLEELRVKLIGVDTTKSITEIDGEIIS